MSKWPDKKKVEPKAQSLSGQLGTAMEMHPLATMLAGMFHGLNSFMALFEANNPPKEQRDGVYRYVGGTLIAIGREYLKESTGDESGETNNGVPATESNDGGNEQ